MDNKKQVLSDKQKTALKLKEDIEKACIKRGLNLTIYDGKIGFVDQEERKIIMAWKPGYKFKGDVGLSKVDRESE